METEVQTPPVQPKREVTKEEIKSWVMKDLEMIISFVNLLRMNPDIFNAVAEIVYQRTQNQDDHAGEQQQQQQ